MRRIHEYFVSPSGSDLNPGTKQQPFATLAGACAVLKPGDTCVLREGFYRETLCPPVSGQPGSEITFVNHPGEEAIITGADRLSDWADEENGIFSTNMSWSLDDNNQVFADGVMLSEACWPAPGDNPLFGPLRAVVDEGDEGIVRCRDIPGPDNAWKGAKLWCAGGASWICWTAEVTAYDSRTHTLKYQNSNFNSKWYTPRAGNLFVLRGVRNALTTPGQWYYDSETKRLLLIPPENIAIDALSIEAKHRMDAVDLSGLSHIRLRGIEIRSAGIRTDEQSSHILLENLKGSHVSHSWTDLEKNSSGILVFGNNIDVVNCDFGYSSSSVLSVGGHDNRIINCHLHHGGYSGLWGGLVALYGRRIVFSHNTVCHAGRDVVRTNGLSESVIQYNDISDAGWLTKDLGMLYGHTTDFANTELKYNLVHDNHAESSSLGIYFDHLSQNAIVHHNVIWNTLNDPVRFNNPSYCNLVFNNTACRTGKTRTFDHSDRGDLFATRYFNNVFNDVIDLPDHVFLENNTTAKEPGFRDPASGDFRLKDDTNKTIGAYAPDGKLWKAGRDPDNMPDPLPVYEPPRIAGMNLVENAGFESGSLKPWQTTDAGKAALVKGNGWGNGWGSDEEIHATGTTFFELRLGPGRDGVCQKVRGLTPGLRHSVSAWLRVSAEEEEVELGVRDHGAPEITASVSTTRWSRVSVDFTPAQGVSEVTIFILKTTEGNGYAWGDNLVLPLEFQ